MEIELGAAAIDELPGDIHELVEQDRRFEAAGEQALEEGEVAQAFAAADLAAGELLFTRCVKTDPGGGGGELGKLGLAGARRSEQENIDAPRAFEARALDQPGDKIAVLGDMLVVGQIERGLKRLAEQRAA